MCLGVGDGKRVDAERERCYRCERWEEGRCIEEEVCLGVGDGKRVDAKMEKCV